MSKIFGENGKSVTKLSLKEGAVIFLVETDEYTNGKFNSEQNNNLKKGFYKLSDYDVLAIHHNSDLFWSFIANNSGLRSEIHEIRKAVGLAKDEVKSKKVGDKIFLPSKTGLSAISLEGKHAEIKLDTTRNIIKYMALYTNFKGASINKLYISSTGRNEIEQANVMVPYLKTKDSDMYPSVRHKLQIEKVHNGMSYFDLWKNGEMSETKFEDLARKLSLAHVNANKWMYLHLHVNGREIMDIGPNGSSHGSREIDLYNTAIGFFRSAGLISAKSKKYDEGKSGEKAYHIVMD